MPHHMRQNWFVTRRKHSAGNFYPVRFLPITACLHRWVTTHLLSSASVRTKMWKNGSMDCSQQVEDFYSHGIHKLPESCRKVYDKRWSILGIILPHFILVQLVYTAANRLALSWKNVTIYLERTDVARRERKIWVRKEERRRRYSHWNKRATRPGERTSDRVRAAELPCRPRRVTARPNRECLLPVIMQSRGPRSFTDRQISAYRLYRGGAVS